MCAALPRHLSTWCSRRDHERRDRTGRSRQLHREPRSQTGKSRQHDHRRRDGTGWNRRGGRSQGTGRIVGRDGEQSRARYPDGEGFVERNGQRLFYEVYGEGEDTIFLLPTWSLFDSRHWKMQIPYLARHFRVLTMDGLGNGRSNRSRDPHRYRAVEFARDCLAVMDATATERAVMVSVSAGARYQLELGRLAPERVLGAVFTGPMFPYTPSHLWLMRSKLVWWAFARPALSPKLYRWWGRFSAIHWRRDFRSLPSGSSPEPSPSRTRPSRWRMALAGRSRPTRLCWPRRSATSSRPTEATRQGNCVGSRKAWTARCWWSQAIAT